MTHCAQAAVGYQHGAFTPVASVPRSDGSGCVVYRAA